MRPKPIALLVHVTQLVAQLQAVLLAEAVAPSLMRLLHVLHLLANAVAVSSHGVYRIAAGRMPLEVARALPHAVGILASLPYVRVPRCRCLRPPLALALPLALACGRSTACTPPSAASLVGCGQTGRCCRHQRGSNDSNEQSLHGVPHARV